MFTLINKGLVVLVISSPIIYGFVCVKGNKCT